jgi:hypothetical protein
MTLVAAVYDSRIGGLSRRSQRRRYRTRASARSLHKGRVGAPPLTHLRGNAAIASGRNAALRLRLGTPRAWRSLPGDYEDAAARLNNGPCETMTPMSRRSCQARRRIHPKK